MSRTGRQTGLGRLAGYPSLSNISPQFPLRQLHTHHAVHVDRHMRATFISSPCSSTVIVVFS